MLFRSQEEDFGNAANNGRFLAHSKSDISFLLSLVEKGLTKRAEPSKMRRLLLDALEAEARGDVTEAQRICHRISEEGAAEE